MIPAGGCFGTRSVAVSTVNGRPQIEQVILYLVGRWSGIPLFSHAQALRLYAAGHLLLGPDTIDKKCWMSILRNGFVRDSSAMVEVFLVA